MRNTIYLLFFLITSCSPGPSSTERAAVVVEIAALDTPEKHTAYLDSLFVWDQAVRQPGSDKGGMSKRDALNLLRVQTYLDDHGWPEGGRGISTVLLHQSYEEQLNLFPVVNAAYRSGNYPTEDFMFLLGRMHLNRFGEPYVPEGAHRPEALIGQLIERMELSPEDSF